MPTAAEVFDLVRRAGERGDVDAFVDLLADDVLIEWMYPIPGWPASMSGKENLREFYAEAAAAARGRSSVFRDVVVHQSTDPDVVIGEYRREITGGDTPFIVVLRVRGGKIVHYRDYFRIGA